MTSDQIFGQLRPILSLAGSILIAVGLLKFFGLNIPMNGSGLEIAVAGYLLKAI
jgi:hypothetical protein